MRRLIRPTQWEGGPRPQGVVEGRLPQTARLDQPPLYHSLREWSPSPQAGRIK
jgi:hypothetical protein